MSTNSPPDLAGGTVATARDLGTLGLTNRRVAFTDFLGVFTDRDDADFYKFTLDTPSQVNVLLATSEFIPQGSLSGFADIQLKEGDNSLAHSYCYGCAVPFGNNTVPLYDGKILNPGTYYFFLGLPHPVYQLYRYNAELLVEPQSSPNPNPNPNSSFDLAAKSLKWGSKKGGLTFQYSVLGDTIPKGTSIPLHLFWASGSSLSNQIQPIQLPNLTLPMTKGTHSVVIPGKFLKQVPSGTTHLIAALDNRNRLIEANETNNVAIAKDVSLTVEPKVWGRPSIYTTSVIKDLLRSSGEANAIVNEMRRTPQDQARIMFDNLRTQGIANQKNLYGSEADKVIDVYVDAITGMSSKAIRANRHAIEAKMVARIKKVGPAKVSHHMSDPNVLQTLDIRPSSFSKNSRELFPRLARRDSRVSKFKDTKDGDLAFHIEIPQISSMRSTQLTGSNLPSGMTTAFAVGSDAYQLQGSRFGYPQ